MKFLPFSKFYYIIGCLSIMIPFLFFAVLAIFSIEYKGVSESSIYIGTLSLSNFLYGIFYISKQITREKFFVTEIFFLFLILFFISYVVILFFFDETFDKDFLYSFLVLVMPVSLFALDLGRNTNGIEIIKKILFSFSLIILLSIAIVIPKMMRMDLNDLITFYGGGHYQGFAYLASFSFLVFLVYFLFYLKSYSKIVRFCFGLVFFVHVLGVFLSGARGGIMVVILGAFFCLSLKYSFVRIFYLILRSMPFVVVLYVVIGFYFRSYQDRFYDSFQRLFSYIGEGGLDMSKTSNRDLLYDESLKLISERPIFGYGIFDYQLLTNGWYPHNFFLEILLQGGIFYLLIWLLILVLFFFKLAFLLRSSKCHFYILPFVLYSFIQLLASGTYLLEPFFWFSIIYVFTAKIKCLNIS